MKNAVVTGGGSGIGQAVAHRLRADGMSLNQLAKRYQVSKATIHKLLKEASEQGGQKTLPRAPSEAADSTHPDSAVLIG